ncbi:MAG TPA: hypothetical protein VK540_07580 [Polyangiaceae bacterium]|nr:hypothetical protein [Polyangiaceae bacterium]
MKPGDHPDFYRFAPPPGTSRESTIRLDADGKFWHDGERVDHPALEKALHSWIALHPDDGRFMLTNGYDWTYFQVDDAPYTVRALRVAPEGVTLVLSDESEEPLAPETLHVGAKDALYAKVKGGRFAARFSRHAQTALAPILHEDKPGALRLTVGGREYPVG